ncbi:MAG: hypothetical protein R3250_12310, partial [Melioribacteraceae bacterium]|nr:hypothetical protein [Melioribacteraceae bacterium]
MKKLLCNLFTFLICFYTLNNSFSQELEEPTAIHPFIGKKLDRIEEEYFKFFPQIDSLHQARFYHNPDGIISARVEYELNGT